MLIKNTREELLEKSRHFVDFPEVIFFDEFYEHVENLPGAEITEFEADGTFEMWLEFVFRENRFFISNKLGDYRFFVEDEECPEEILLEIAEHFRQLLEKDDSGADEADFYEGIH